MLQIVNTNTTFATIAKDLSRVMKRAILILLFVASQVGLAQSKSDTVNFTDANGLKQGYWKEYNSTLRRPGYTDAALVQEGRYADSKKKGQWKEYYPNGNVKNKITYENNRPNGYAIMYHDNGKISEEGLWQNNRWVGDYKLYYDNGQVAQEFKFNKSGKREGPQVYYYENGQKMIEGNWAEGKEAGVVKEYYETGEIKEEKNFSNGTLDAASVKHYQPKKPIKETPDPVKETPKVVVKVDEKPNMPNQIFNGEGKWTLYNKNKQISKDGIFSKGRLINGKAYFYTDDGILTRIAVYKDGRYVGDTVIEE